MEDNFFKKIARFLLSPFWGKKFWQKSFELLHLFALKGMNFGGGATYSASGEEWVLDYIAKQGSNPAVVFDGGANKGEYALMAQRVFERRGRPIKIYCFEPSKATFAMLQKNINKSSSIMPINSGLGESQSQSVLYSDGAGSGLASVYNRDLPEQHQALTMQEQVAITSVDGFCKQNNIGRIDFLKLDIEGFEMAALRGSSAMLKNRAISAIQFEFGGADIDARVFFKDFYNLLSPDFNIYRILQNGLYPIKHYRETDEVFITTNYFAELK
jgi:FkbM family methyltransferase